jgi:hypothetical protein
VRHRGAEQFERLTNGVCAKHLYRYRVFRGSTVAIEQHVGREEEVVLIVFDQEH